jgi:cytosolic 5'-nucleotidase 3
MLFRPLVHEFFGSCERAQVPVLVFSAGLYDMIDLILREANLHSPNIHIVSNQMAFYPDTGEAHAFPGRLIHVFNKSEAALGSYANTIASRRNVILVGDSVGDLHMGDGLTHDVSLTVGFLNHGVEDLMDTYTQAFDIVIARDVSMELLVVLLGLISSGA